MDVKNVFLHVNLYEEINMEQSPSYVDQTHLNLVYRSKKAPRVWSTRQVSVLSQMNSKYPMYIFHYM
jgi:hypothetical protein